MYESFSIRNFRCIEELAVKTIAPVNLIVGYNNAGKTALLEALWIHSGPNVPDLGIRLSRFRGILSPDPNRLLHDLFLDFNTDKTIQLNATGNWNDQPRILKIRSQPVNQALTSFPAVDGSITPSRSSQETDIAIVSDSEIVLEYTDEKGQSYLSTGVWVKSNSIPVQMAPNLQLAMTNEGMSVQTGTTPTLPTSVFVSARHRPEPEEDTRRFAELELDGRSSAIVQCLKAVDDRIQRLTTLATAPKPMLYAEVGLSRLIPVGMLGDGMGRFLSMALAFYQAREGMILIDEVENGFHYTVLPEVWRNLYKLSKDFNVQIFATTHSRECIVAARDAFVAEGSQELCVFRLDQGNKKHSATSYSFEGIDFNLEYGSDLR